jgi:hypothetical protein
MSLTDRVNQVLKIPTWKLTDIVTFAYKFEWFTDDPFMTKALHIVGSVFTGSILMNGLQIHLV